MMKQVKAMYGKLKSIIGGPAAGIPHQSHELASVEVAQRKDDSGVWTVEAIGPDGEIYQAIFLGPDSELRAREYAWTKYSV